MAKKLTLSKVLAAYKRSLVTDEYPGFCLACGKKQLGVEPDARMYKCESCGAEKVYGAEELVMMYA